jgi:hypothetical protein
MVEEGALCLMEARKQGKDERGLGTKYNLKVPSDLLPAAR